MRSWKGGMAVNRQTPSLSTCSGCPMILNVRSNKLQRKTCPNWKPMPRNYARRNIEGRLRGVRHLDGWIIEHTKDLLPDALLDGLGQHTVHRMRGDHLLMRTPATAIPPIASLCAFARHHRTTLATLEPAVDQEMAVLAVTWALLGVLLLPLLGRIKDVLRDDGRH